VHQELERAGVDVADRARAGERGLGEPALGPRLEIRRRRLIDELLMAALDRALALVQMHDRAFAVAEDLHLDVAGRFEIALHVHLTLADRSLAATERGWESGSGRQLRMVR